MYQHLAKGSEKLLPEAEQIAFFKQSQLPLKHENSEDQPRDYSEGSSGLLKS
ncbi:Protein of uncharacterised function (DUF1043) [Actinobacillus equuli]|nr:Protein of uncharacterised function (DUF1043) [Actinobacillus equuli]